MELPDYSALEIISDTDTTLQMKGQWATFILINEQKEKLLNDFLLTIEKGKEGEREHSAI